MRVRRLRSALAPLVASMLVASGGAALAVPGNLPPSVAGSALELKTTWGHITPALLASRPASAATLEAPAVELINRDDAAASSLDVNHVLRFKPHIVERAPYVPGTQVPDHVATAAIVAGGAAILTSIIADWAGH